MLKIHDMPVSTEHDGIANSMGYGVHATQTRLALERAGVTFAESANIVLHQTPAYLAKRQERKINILYTACEAPNLPQNYIDAANTMDLVIGVSEFVANTFRKHVKVPVACCPLGVDTEAFSYVKREMPKDRPFTFLWVGAPNVRKGWEIVRNAWHTYSNFEDVRLVVKTTGRGKLEQSGNVIVDSRKLDTAGLAQLYHQAHCFLFPSYGEGFGLPLAEAMSTGLPCIYTPWAGVTEFASRKNAIPLNYKMVSVNYGVQTVGALADVRDLVQKIESTVRDYRRALRKGKRAARTIRAQFTWDQAGTRMKNIIEGFVNGIPNHH